MSNLQSLYRSEDQRLRNEKNQKQEGLRFLPLRVNARDYAEQSQFQSLPPIKINTPRAHTNLKEPFTKTEPLDSYSIIQTSEKRKESETQSVIVSPRNQDNSQSAVTQSLIREIQKALPKSIIQDPSFLENNQSNIEEIKLQDGPIIQAQINKMFLESENDIHNNNKSYYPVDSASASKLHDKSFLENGNQGENSISSESEKTLLLFPEERYLGLTDPYSLGQQVKNLIEQAAPSATIQLPDCLFKLKELRIQKPLTLKGSSGTIMEITHGSIVADFGSEDEHDRYKDVIIICECHIVFTDRADLISIREELENNTQKPDFKSARMRPSITEFKISAAQQQAKRKGSQFEPRNTDDNEDYFSNHQDGGDLYETLRKNPSQDNNNPDQTNYFNSQKTGNRVLQSQEIIEIEKFLQKEEKKKEVTVTQELLMSNSDLTTSLIPLFVIKNHTYVELRDCYVESKNKDQVMDVAFVLNENNEENFQKPYKGILSIKSCNIVNFSLAFLAGSSSILSVELSHLTYCRHGAIVAINPKLLKISGSVIDKVDGNGVEIIFKPQNNNLQPTFQSKQSQLTSKYSSMSLTNMGSISQRDVVKKIYVEENKISNCKQTAILMKTALGKSKSMKSFSYLSKQSYPLIKAIVKLCKNKIFNNRQCGLSLQKITLQQLEVSHNEFAMNSFTNVLLERVNSGAHDSYSLVFSKCKFNQSYDNGFISKDSGNFTVQDCDFYKNKQSGIFIYHTGAKKFGIGRKLQRSKDLMRRRSQLAPPSLLQRQSDLVPSSLFTESNNPYNFEQKSNLLSPQMSSMKNLAFISANIQQRNEAKTTIDTNAATQNAQLLSPQATTLKVDSGNQISQQRRGSGSRNQRGSILRTRNQDEVESYSEKIEIGTIILNRCRLVENKGHGIVIEDLYRTLIEIRECKVVSNNLNGINLQQDLEPEQEIKDHLESLISQTKQNFLDQQTIIKIGINDQVKVDVAANKLQDMSTAGLAQLIYHKYFTSESAQRDFKGHGQSQHQSRHTKNPHKNFPQFRSPLGFRESDSINIEGRLREDMKLLVMRRDILQDARVKIINSQIFGNKESGIMCGYVRTSIINSQMCENYQYAINIPCQNMKYLLSVLGEESKDGSRLSSSLKLNKGLAETMADRRVSLQPLSRDINRRTSQFYPSQAQVEQPNFNSKEEDFCHLFIQGRVGGEWGEILNPLKDLGNQISVKACKNLRNAQLKGQKDETIQLQEKETQIQEPKKRNDNENEQAQNQERFKHISKQNSQLVKQKSSQTANKYEEAKQFQSDISIMIYNLMLLEKQTADLKSSASEKSIHNQELKKQSCLQSSTLLQRIFSSCFKKQSKEKKRMDLVGDYFVLREISKQSLQEEQNLIERLMEQAKRDKETCQEGIKSCCSCFAFMIRTELNQVKQEKVKLEEELPAKNVQFTIKIKRQEPSPVDQNYLGSNLKLRIESEQPFTRSPNPDFETGCKMVPTLRGSNPNYYNFDSQRQELKEHIEEFFQDQ